MSTDDSMKRINIWTLSGHIRDSAIDSTRGILTEHRNVRSTEGDSDI